jgi:hypothetical protein
MQARATFITGAEPFDRTAPSSKYMIFIELLHLGI